MAEQRDVDRYVESPEAGLGGDGPIVDQTVLAPESDAEIEQAVHQALRLDPDVEADHFVVSVEQGVASLSGRAGSSHERARALRAASLVHGVQRVEDRLAE